MAETEKQKHISYFFELLQAEKLSMIKFVLSKVLPFHLFSDKEAVVVFI